MIATIHAATLTVSNTLDAGAGSLRQALIDAAATNGADTVLFQLPGSPPFSIALLSALPTLNDVTLDGSSQSGYADQPLIELNGTSAGSGTIGLTLGNNNQVRGLAINRFGGDAIRCNGASNSIAACYLGTDVTGTIARGNGGNGISVFGTPGNLIGGVNPTDRNVIAGGNDTGIYLLNPTASANLIIGNYIGVSAPGINRLGNRNNGIAIYSAPGNVIGGSAPGMRNVISGNAGSGINVNGTSSSGNVIQGNYVGIAATGSLALSNSADGITLNAAGGNWIGGTNASEGNVISGNGQTGIFANGSGTVGNFIQGNLIGTDPMGVFALPNNFAGITFAGANSNIIGGAVVAARNVISGNRLDGVFLTNSAGNVIQGNYIGANADGSFALPNQTTGVTLYNSSYNLVSGDPNGARSVISGNGSLGVWINGAASSNNSVQGSFIGVDATGTNALGNASDGVHLTGSSFNQIGGLTPGQRNVISGNGFTLGVGGGCVIEGASASQNSFLGNYIGTDSTGLKTLQNRNEGFYLISTRGNFIGGSQIGAGNVISGNKTMGILLTNTSGNQIAGNYIGVLADGASPAGNGYLGIELNEGSLSNLVGGLAANAGNRIAFNGVSLPRAGVRVRDGSGGNPTNAVANGILGNAIYANAALGIDISTAGVTLNDPCDGDTGGNQRQNFPVLTQAVSGSNTGIRGTLDSTPNTRFRLQFFASPNCDSSGYGQGQIYLGDAVVQTGGICTTNFVATLPGNVPAGYVVTATATDPTNNTSEFSACQVVGPTPTLQIGAPSTNQFSLLWTNTATGFVLKQTTNLSPPVVWTTVTNAPAISNGQFVVNLSPPSGNRFFLLSFE